VRRQAQASSAGSLKGSGARSGGWVRSLLAVLALATLALALTTTTAGASPPVGTVETISNVSYATVHLTGTVGPATELNTYYYFQYSTDQVHWTNGPSWQGEFPERSFPESETPTPVEENLTGLKGETKYYVRLGTFDFGSFSQTFEPAPYKSFTTLHVDPPSVLSINNATGVEYSRAQVSGSVERPATNPDPAFDTNCYFEYVTNKQFTEHGFENAGKTGCKPHELITTTGPTAVTAELTELQPGTTYHLRLTAENGAPTVSKEAASTFTTLVVAPPTILPAASTVTTNTTAEIAATVSRMSGSDPALNAECRFEYISAAAYQGRSLKVRITVQATNGTYSLGWEGQYGPEIAYNATAAQLQAALETFVGIGPGAINVSGGPGSPTGSSPYLVTFIGPLANKNVGGFYYGSSSGDVNLGITVTSEGHAEGFENAAQTPCNPSPITTAGTNPISATLTGLPSNTSFHLRVVASNAGGTSTEELSNFKTGEVPGAQTLIPDNVQESSARIGGRVNPAGSNITYQFEWGTSSSYQNLLPAAPEPLSASDSSFHVVSVPLTGLEPETVYHYRVVATNIETGQVTKGDDEAFETLPAEEAEACPNESFRVGLSAGLPDCRVLEWVSPELNGTAIFGGLASSPEGNHIRYDTLDAPENTESAETLFEQVASDRGPKGWSSRSLMPPIKVQVSTYGNTGGLNALSEDFSKSVVSSKQPLAGAESPPSGINLYYHPTYSSTYIPMTVHGASYYAGESVVYSRDFTHFFYTSDVSKQLPEDPLAGGNTYEWTLEGHHLSLIGWLPASEGHPEKLAPTGAYMPQPQNGKGTLVSADGSQVLYKIFNEPGLYLRSEAKHSVEVSASQRTVKDPNPIPNARQVGISDDGSKAFFESASELTNDANTGKTEGVANDSGSDLYSYDIGTEKLTDLTVDNNPADAATGANVQWVLGHTANFDYIYFIARGDLAPGGVSGAENLYVWHEGEISYIAENPSGYQESGYHFYVTPNGRNAAFLSATIPTAYDNVNPKTTEPMAMVFKYTYKGTLECASCRPSGAPPSSGADISGRAISNDGSKLFFASSDSILPQSVNNIGRVYEYQRGEVSLISPPDAVNTSYLFDASESGEDVFFQTVGELTPQKQGSIASFYDARVNATRPAPPEAGCQGENCRGAPTSAQSTQSPGTATFEATVRVAVSEAGVSKSSKTHLRVIVPEAGNVSIVGKGLKDVKKSVSKAGSTTVTVALTSGANKKRLRKGAFMTEAQIIFASSSGNGSRDEVPLKFEAGAKKGGK
jgi:hypothetical protein